MQDDPSAQENNSKSWRHTERRELLKEEEEFPNVYHQNASFSPIDNICIHILHSTFISCKIFVFHTFIWYAIVMGSFDSLTRGRCSKQFGGRLVGAVDGNEYLGHLWKHQGKSPPTNQPTNRPTNQPTNQPTDQPTNQPTNPPTNQPTNQPTKVMIHIHLEVYHPRLLGLSRNYSII